jgi:1-phosphatidylinositol phosphodiesterase
VRVLAIAVTVSLGACAGDAAWMSRLEDSRGIWDIMIPGTHDSGALLEPLPGLAKTQELTIAEQLDAGVRFLDLRARIVDDQFWLYHGAIDQDQAFDDVFDTMYAFLDANPTEVIIASLKEETAPSNATKAFDTIFAEYVAKSPEHWDLRTRLTHLGEVRGRIMLVRRFSSTMSPLGIDASPWQDNATFRIDNGETKLLVQDHYAVDNNDDKWSAIQSVLGTYESLALRLDFTSGYHTNDMGLPNILAVSDDINARLDATLDPRDAGSIAPTILIMDHVTPERVKRVLEVNIFEPL